MSVEHGQVEVGSACIADVQ
jgi:hypothetical protein